MQPLTKKIRFQVSTQSNWEKVTNYKQPWLIPILLQFNAEFFTLQLQTKILP